MLLFLYVAVLLILPTGSLFGINVKMLLFLAVLVLTMARQGAKGWKKSSSFVFVLAFIGVLLIWTINGILRGFPSGAVLSQFRDIAVTVVNCWMIASFTENRQDARLMFLKVVVYSVAFVATIKCAMLAYSLNTGTPVSALNELINRAFHIQLMTLDFDPLNSSLGRIQFVSDSVLPVCLFTLIARRQQLGIPRWLALPVMVLYSLSIAVSFSRYSWAYALLAVALGMIVCGKEWLTWLYLLLGATGIALNWNTLTALWTLRFSNVVAGSSDIDRTLQMKALQEFFLSAPVFGHGLGSFTSIVIRSRELPYSYENQLLALLGQVGAVGVLLLIAILIFYFRALIGYKQAPARYRAAIFLMLAGWVLGGVFNPFLISSTASVAYGVLYVLIFV
jgi:hypothetical protein